MKSLTRRPKSEAIVRFQDCDPFGHLNNSKYIDYFMNAREDHLVDHYGLNIYAISAKEGVGWVVAQNQIAYLQPAMLMEKVWITSRLINYTPRGLTVEFVMYNKDESIAKAMMWSQFAYFDISERKAIVHDDKYTELFKRVHDPVGETLFEDRVKRFRSQNQVSPKNQ